MDFLLTPEAGLWGLFLSSFLAATLLPGGSEAVLLLLLAAHPEQALPALLLATAGNTLGGMSTYTLGRLLPLNLGAGEATALHGGRAQDALMKPLRSRAVEQRTRSSPLQILAAADGDTKRWQAHHIDRLQRHGPVLLLLAWTPILGDALCAAAGWLRLSWVLCASWMLLGKFARYAVLVWLI